MIEVFKKSFKLCVIVVMVSTRSLAQSHEPKPFTIEATLTGLVQPATLILTLQDGDQWTELKSESVNGKFFISGYLNEPSFAFLVLKYQHELSKAPRRGNTREIFIDPGKLIVHPADSIRDAAVAGGDSERTLELLNELLSANAKKESRQVTIGAFVKNHPNSFVSLYALQNLTGQGTFIIDPELAPPLFEQLTPALRNTETGKRISSEIQLAKATAVGSVAPEFSQTDSLDRIVTLSSFRGNYVLIDFWASWCGPCRKENPAMMNLYQRFTKRNFRIVGVALDKSRKAWTAAIRKDKLSWTNISDLKYWRNEVALRYGVKTIPQNFLLDPEGRIIARNISIEPLAAKLEKLLAEVK